MSDKIPADAPVVRPKRAPSLQKPDTMSDVEWAIVKASNNVALAAHVMAVSRGEAEITPEVAADLFDVVKSAEMKSLGALRRLQKGYRPKVKAATDQYNGLMSLSAHLFKKSTEL